MESSSMYLEQITKMAIEYAPNIIKAVLMLFIGFWVIGWITKMLQKVMDQRNIEETIQPFIISLVNVSLKVLLLLAVASMFGLETTSFVAVLAAAGFAIGMALQGSLSNFAAGVMILIFRPYKVGDVIEVEDQMGHVDEVQIFNTIIKTFDNKTVIIPNGTAISGIITNLSEKKHLRVDLNVTMPYAEDFDKVERVIKAAIKEVPGVLSDPEPFVGIEAFDSHSIVLAVRPYCTVEDYWDVFFECNRRIKRAMSENDIRVAYSEGVEMGTIGR